MWHQGAGCSTVRLPPAEPSVPAGPGALTSAQQWTPCRTRSAQRSGLLVACCHRTRSGPPSAQLCPRTPSRTSWRSSPPSRRRLPPSHRPSFRPPARKRMAPEPRARDREYLVAGNLPTRAPLGGFCWALALLLVPSLQWLGGSHAPVCCAAAPAWRTSWPLTTPYPLPAHPAARHAIQHVRLRLAGAAGPVVGQGVPS